MVSLSTRFSITESDANKNPANSKALWLHDLNAEMSPGSGSTTYGMDFNVITAGKGNAIWAIVVYQARMGADQMKVHQNLFLRASPADSNAGALKNMLSLTNKRLGEKFC